jgi:hypothetical protein
MPDPSTIKTGWWASAFVCRNCRAYKVLQLFLDISDTGDAQRGWRYRPICTDCQLHESAA